MITLNNGESARKRSTNSPSQPSQKYHVNAIRNATLFVLASFFRPASLDGHDSELSEVGFGIQNAISVGSPHHTAACAAQIHTLS
jgi:hypothetical protein